jgi:hypothetical protein
VLPVLLKVIAKVDPAVLVIDGRGPGGVAAAGDPRAGWSRRC